jgi:tetratricopeptide (TPR) repeat protein
VAGLPPSRRLHAEQVLVSLGAAYMLAGRSDAARRWAREALAESQRHGARACEAGALHLAGELASLEDACAGEAEGHYRQALALAVELGLRPLVAHCYLGLARLARRIGKPQEAEEPAAAALRIYREMGMRCWLEEAQWVRESVRR